MSQRITGDVTITEESIHELESAMDYLDACALNPTNARYRQDENYLQGMKKAVKALGLTVRFDVGEPDENGKCGHFHIEIPHEK